MGVPRIPSVKGEEVDEISGNSMGLRSGMFPTAVCRILILLLLLVSIPGCQRNHNHEQPPPESPVSERPARLAPSNEVNQTNEIANRTGRTAASGEHVMLQGRVFAEPDVRGQPLSPFRSGHVVLIRAGEMEQLKSDAPQAMEAASGTAARPDAPLLDRTLFERYVAAWTEIDSTGRYTIRAEPGTYLIALCGQVLMPDEVVDRIVDEAVSEKGFALPTVLLDWTKVSLPSAERHSIDLFYDGEARRMRAEETP